MIVCAVIILSFPLLINSGKPPAKPGGLSLSIRRFKPPAIAGQL